MTPIYGAEDLLTGQKAVTAYIVSTKLDGSDTYTANLWLGKVHIVANGDRYLVEVSKGYDSGEDGIQGTADDVGTINVYKVKKLVFREVSVTTMDFSTQFGSERLSLNLFNNLRQYMMNQIIQGIVDNISGSTITLNPSAVIDQNVPVPAHLDKYLDMFSDSVSQDNYIVSQVDRVSIDSPDYAKFCQVYKNHIVDIDDSNIYKGNLYKYLDGLIQGGTNSAFGNSNYLTLVDEPSIKVTRVSLSGKYTHKFEYTVWFDVYFRNKKSVFDSGVDKTFMVGDVVVKHVKCVTTFIPKYDGGFALNTPMKYDVTYTVKGEQYDVEYDQVIYRFNGKTRTKFVDPVASKFTPSEFSTTTTTRELPHLTEELVSQQVETLFNFAKLKEWAVYINNTIFKPLGRQIIVQQDILKNQNDSDGRWNIVESGGVLQNEAIPAAVSANVKALSYGKTIIDGRVYAVQATPNQIKEIGGGKTLQILNMEAHKQPKSDGYDAAANKEKVLVAMGGKIVEKNAITDNFTMRQNPSDATDKIMQFKGAAAKFSAVNSKSLSSAADLSGTTINFTNMSSTGLDYYCNSFGLNAAQVTALKSSIVAMDNKAYVYLTKKVKNTSGVEIEVPVSDVEQEIVGFDLTEGTEFDLYDSKLVANPTDAEQEAYIQRISEWSSLPEAD